MKSNDLNFGVTAVAGTTIALSGVVLLVNSSQEQLQKMIRKTRIALFSMGHVICSKCVSFTKSINACMQDLPQVLGHVSRTTGKGLASIIDVCLDCFSEGAQLTVLQCTKLAKSATKATKYVRNVCANEIVPAMEHTLKYLCLGVDVTISTMQTWAWLTITSTQQFNKNLLTFAGQVMESITSFLANNLVPAVNLAISQTLRVINTVGQFLNYYLDEGIYFGGIALQFIWSRTNEIVQSSCGVVSSVVTSSISSLCLVPHAIGDLVQSFGSLVVPSLYLIVKSPGILFTEGGYFLLSVVHTFLLGCKEAIEKLELPVEWVCVDDLDRMSVVPYMSVPLELKRGKGRSQVLVLKPGAQKVFFIVSSLTGILEVVTNIPERR
jgi:hypothetical protein